MYPSFTSNTAGSDGGAINSRNTGVTIDGADITLQGRIWREGNGGAVFENSGSVLMGDANGATVEIMGNIAGHVAGSNGGAIYDNNGSVTENGNVTLTNNMAPVREWWSHLRDERLRPDQHQWRERQRHRQRRRIEWRRDLRGEWRRRHDWQQRSQRRHHQQHGRL